MEKGKIQMSMGDYIEVEVMHNNKVVAVKIVELSGVSHFKGVFMDNPNTTLEFTQHNIRKQKRNFQ